MRDYWLTQYVLGAVGWGYLLLAALALILAAWLPKGRKAKVVSFLVVLGLTSVIPIGTYQRFLVEQETAAKAKERYAKAKTLFDERCKTAGERIHKTVSGVETIALLKVRPKRINSAEQYVLDDPYGRDVRADGYIASFLRPAHSAAYAQGYRYVDVLKSPASPVRYELVERASQAGNPFTELRHVTTIGEVARYGIDYEDISSTVDRDHWIAGGRTRIFDLLTEYVLAERVGFLFDAGLGDRRGGRNPWEAAVTCRNEDRKYGHNARFAMRVLKPKEGN